MKSLEAKTGDNLGDPEFDNDFSDTTPKSWSMKDRTDNLDLIKMVKFCSEKNTIKIIKIYAANWEKIFANYLPDRWLIVKYVKNA